MACVASHDVEREMASLRKAWEENVQDAWTVQNHVKVSMSTHLRVASPLSVLCVPPPPPAWLEDMWLEMKSDEQSVMRVARERRRGEREPRRFRGIAKRRRPTTVDDAMSALQRCSLTSCTTLAVWKPRPPPPCRTREAARAALTATTTTAPATAMPPIEAFSNMMREAFGTSSPCSECEEE